MSSCVFPGSFDPMTKGHFDLILRASELFSRVTVTLMINIHKQGFLSPDDRLKLLRKACSGIGNVTVDSWDGLLADYMRIHDEHIVLRGVRSSAEFEQEYAAARMNRQLNGGVETLLLPSSPELDFVSSSAVRELAAFGGDIRPYVPDSIREEIRAILSK